MSKVMVLRVKEDEIEEVKSFYENLGLIFVEEQHETGPKHYACEMNGFVFEIYPQGNKSTGIKFF